MKTLHANLRTFAATVTMLVVSAGLVFAQQQATAPAGQPSGGQPYAGGGEEGSAAGPTGATGSSLVPILYVTGIEVVQTALEPKETLVRVTGLASSEGWSSVELVPFYYGKPLDEVLDLQFVASSPSESQKAEGFVAVSATFNVDPRVTFKAVRIRAATNALELTQIPGTTKTEIKTDDCKQCIGKKFADKGQAPAGTPNVVRAEDLPRGFRTIAPSHGVAGIVHNPNRINLILDANNVITMVFWE